MGAEKGMHVAGAVDKVHLSTLKEKNHDLGVSNTIELKCVYQRCIKINTYDSRSSWLRWSKVF